MNIAALIAWLITALGGFSMLGTWIARGGPRDGTSRLPVPVIFGHALLAAAGLLVWIAYLFAGTAALAWTAFIILLPVALLGFAMFARWLPTARDRSGPTTAEHAFPIPVVLGHGLFAVATLALVVITALQA